MQAGRAGAVRGPGWLKGISYDAARALDRYLRVRAQHAQAYRPQLWLGINNRGPMTPSGIYQVIARRGRQCGMKVFPHRFRHHFKPHLARPRRRRGRPDGAQRLDIPVDAPPLRHQRPQRQSPPQLRPHHGEHVIIRAASISPADRPWSASRLDRRIHRCLAERKRRHHGPGARSADRRASGILGVPQLARTEQSVLEQGQEHWSRQGDGFADRLRTCPDLYWNRCPGWVRHVFGTEALG
jgi:hypothetical protein